MNEGVSNLGRYLWKHFFLIFLVGLLVFALSNVINAYDYPAIRTNAYGLVIGVLGQIFMHIAFYYTKTGWKSKVMKTVAWVWLGLMMAYIFMTYRK